MRAATVTCVTIAGLDPSHGAGFTRDAHTFEKLGVNHFSVCTALTLQDDTHFEHVKWIKPTYVMRQLKFILEHYNVNAIKIGLIENADLLIKICKLIKNKNIALIWDPILQSSTGYTFHSGFSSHKLEQICSFCTVITPNRDEMRQLMPKTEDEASARSLVRYCAVLLKGGHDNNSITRATDILYTSKGEERFTHPRLSVTLHGTGCRYSAALCAHLAKGETLSNACNMAGLYVYNCLLDNVKAVIK